MNTSSRAPKLEKESHEAVKVMCRYFEKNLFNDRLRNKNAKVREEGLHQPPSSREKSVMSELAQGDDGTSRFEISPGTV